MGTDDERRSLGLRDGTIARVEGPALGAVGEPESVQRPVVARGEHEVTGPAAADGRIYVSDGAGAFYALDMATGQLRWKSWVSLAAKRRGNASTPGSGGGGPPVTDADDGR